MRFSLWTERGNACFGSLFTTCSRNTNDGENGRGTDQHTKSGFLYLLFIRTRGPEKQGTYVCVLCFLLLVTVCFVSSFFFVWHVIEGEGWPWSDLVHAYPQNERTVLFAFLISSLFSPPPPFTRWESRGLSSTQDQWVSCLFFVSSHKDRATSFPAFLVSRAGRDNSGLHVLPTSHSRPVAQISIMATFRCYCCYCSLCL